jgi:hypothetical protein
VPATVTLDTSGQLIVFSRFIDSADERNRGVTPSTMFAEAGLSEGDFVAITPARRPAVPHDSAMAWARGEDASKIRVSSATLGGAARVLRSRRGGRRRATEQSLFDETDSNSGSVAIPGDRGVVGEHERDGTT